MKKFLLALVVLATATFSSRAQIFDSLATGPNDWVNVLRNYSGGLAVGGKFTKIGTSTVINLTTRTASGWSNELANQYNNAAIASNISNTSITALEEYETDIHIGGDFYNYLYYEALNVAFLDNTGSEYSFQPYYSNANEPAYAMQTFDGKLFVGGGFTDFTGNDYIGYVDGSSPSPGLTEAGSGLNNSVYSFVIYNNELYAGGAFTMSGSTEMNHIAKWNGTDWEAVGTGLDGNVQAMAVYNNELIVGGNFSNAGSVAASKIAKWNGTAWSALGTGVSGTAAHVGALEVYNAKLYAGGRFNSAGGNTASNLASWNGTTWTAAGSGTDNNVSTMEVFENKLYVGGRFTSAGGKPIKYLATFSDQPNSITEPGRAVYDVNVYPNPAAAHLTVANQNFTGETLTGRVYDVLGKEAMRFQLEGTYTNVDVSSLPAGAYVFQLSGKAGAVRVPLSVQ